MALGLIREFRDFIVKGNAFDLAVGIIIGAAFGALVTSLVNDVIMPPLGAAMGGVDFADKGYVLVPELKGTTTQPTEHPITGLPVTKDTKPVVLAYGKFINACIALLIQGFAIFMVVKLINRLRRQEPTKEAAPPPMPEDVKLLAEIRDLLKSRPE